MGAIVAGFGTGAIVAGFGIIEVGIVGVAIRLAANYSVMGTDFLFKVL